MAYNVQDRAGNAVALKTVADGSGNLSGSSVVTDAAGVNQAEVASRIGAANQAPGTGNALQVGAVVLLQNVAGNVDALREGGIDLLGQRGILPVAPTVGTRTTATSTSSVSSGTASATLSVAATAGFVVGGVCNFEPGTSRYEPAVVTAVVANTSVSVAFPSGGALYTHTANYTIETFQPSVAREAPGRQGAALVSSDGTKYTYRSGAVAQTFYSTAAAVLVEIVGSSTKTVRVKKIVVWGQAGTKYYAELTMLRCTAASAGSANIAAIGQHDVNDPSATAVVNYYTAAAAAGAGNAVMGARPLAISAPSADVQMIPTIWDFAQSQDKALILRGTGDVIEIYNNTTSVGTATFGFEVEWEEDNS
jgi:hypothetical protein